jgi:uncharacterized protein
MGFRSSIFLLMVVFNFLPLFALWSAVRLWIASKSAQRIVLVALALFIFVSNIPISVFWIRSLYDDLYVLSPSTLQQMFLPALVWQTTALLFTLLLGPIYVIWLARRVAKSAIPRKAATPQPSPTARQAPISRRAFVTGGAGLLVPTLYVYSAWKLHDSMADVDISRELPIPIPHLPRSFDGMTIVQLSDLHVGPYVRQKQLEYWVTLVNRLRPDLVVLTGDVIDRSLSSLPETIAGLSGLRAPLGVLAVLGNHDISSDRYSSRGNFMGGERIAEGMKRSGIRTLRNEVTYLASGQERLAIMGLDWITSASGGSAMPGGPNFFNYYSAETRTELTRMAAEIPPETPAILLAHHPDTFKDVSPFEIGLTLSGHTHGGQIVLFNWNGAPVTPASTRFKYTSGLYQENGRSLYVNRGLGYLGVPIRINCPPEISRFRLTRPEST